ncbi:MAG: hypothetical protein CM15mP25_0230 [Gammaproteobacteria bacterium]|nr:MAG: hypothetical protein CM15mP25_0230 [Gammaproteobacteria bacterium]
MVTENQVEIDKLIDAWYVVTMNETRDIVHRGSVAVHKDKIVDIGKTLDLEKRYQAKERLGGDRFVLTPGLVNTHIHITGEPITRGYVPDDTPLRKMFSFGCVRSIQCKLLRRRSPLQS